MRDFMSMVKQLNLLLACTFLSVSVQAQDSIDVMLDWFVNPDHAALIVAEQKGLFDEQGLNVNLQEPADPSMPPKLVAAGKVDFAVTYQPELIQDVAHGLPLTRISTLIATPLNTLMVLEGGDIKSIADLKGKSIGTAISGGVSDATIGVMLENSGLTLTDVSIINVGWALSSSLASNKVDAIYGGYRNFEMHQLAMEGFQGKAFFVEEEGVPPYDELVVVANSDKLNAAQIKRFNRALELATQFIINHPDDAWLVFKSYKKDLDTKLNQLAWKDTLSRLALRPAAYDVNRYQDYAEFLQTSGIISKVPNTQDYLF
jgi:putative hydroxymethylpyrimidine transport system substrate-binding protein